MTSRRAWLVILVAPALFLAAQLGAKGSDAPAATNNRPEVSIDAAKLAEFAGTYQLDAHRYFTAVVDQAGRLRIRLTGQPFFPYVYVGNDRFRNPRFAAEFAFSRNAAGQIEKVTMRQSWMEMIARRMPGPGPTVLFPSAEKLQPYVGTYEFSADSRLEITVNGDQLFAQLAAQPAFPVYCDRPDHFVYEVINAAVNFERNADNTVSGLTLDQGARSTRASRLPSPKP